MDPWHWWLIAAIILMIAEVLTSDFLFAPFGIASLATATVAGVGLGPTGQLGTFTAAAVLCLAIVRPAVKRWLYESCEGLKTNTDSLIGRQGTVTDEVGGESAPGRVKIGGEEWRAVSQTGLPLAPGTVIEIVALDGATLTIRPLAAP
jgi:membrane protein implicated in regulation of membrane protease activity